MLKTTFDVKLLNAIVSVANWVQASVYTKCTVALWINWKVPVSVAMVAGMQDCSAIIHTKERQAITNLEQLHDEQATKNIYQYQWQTMGCEIL